MCELSRGSRARNRGLALARDLRMPTWAARDREPGTLEPSTLDLSP